MIDDIVEFIYKFISWFGAENRYVYVLGICSALVIIFLIYLGLRKLKYKYMERIVYTREFTCETAYAKDHAELVETIYNPTYFPLFRIDVEEFIFGGLWLDGDKPDAGKPSSSNDMQEIVSRFNLLPFQQIKRHHDVFCQNRGYFEIKSVRIPRSTEPLFIDAPASLYVFPEIIDINIQSFPISCLLGEYASLRRLVQDPFSFAGIRDYRFGDSMSSINYKATAKYPIRSASDIKVNAREYCTGRIFMVYQNFHIPKDNKTLSDNYDRIMEYGLSVSAAVLRDANDAGCKCGFAANCGTVDGDMSVRFPLKSGDEHMKSVLKGMALLRPNDGLSVKYLLQKDVDDGMNNCEIIFITTYIDDEIDEKLRLLKQFTNSVSIITISEEDIKG